MGIYKDYKKFYESAFYNKENLLVFAQGKIKEEMLINFCLDKVETELYIYNFSLYESYEFKIILLNKNIKVNNIRDINRISSLMNSFIIIDNKFVIFKDSKYVVVNFSDNITTELLLEHINNYRFK